MRFAAILLASILAPANSLGLVYVSDANANAVYVYNAAGRHQRPIQTITMGIDAPQGLFVDAQRNLYVPNSIGENVTIYTPNGSQPIETLADPYGLPAAVVKCNDGTVYVANFRTYRNGADGPGNIAVYAQGASSPTSWIESQYTAPRYLACDRSSRLYASYMPLSTSGALIRYGPGGTGGRRIPIGPGPIQIDDAGDIVVWSGGFNIDFYHPERHVAFKELAVPNGDIPDFFSFDKGDRNLWVVVKNQKTIRLSVQTSKLTDTIGPFGFAEGVAVSPPDH